MTASFAPFEPKVRFHWDPTTFFAESDNKPNNIPNRMAGITSWHRNLLLADDSHLHTDEPVTLPTALTRTLIAST